MAGAYISGARSHDCIVQNMRIASVRAARRKLVKLFKKLKSKFYWYDFTVGGRRYWDQPKRRSPLGPCK